MSTLGTRIKVMRLSRGLSQIDLAKLVGVSRSTVTMWETDQRRPGYETLDVIADVFNAPLSALLKDEKQQQEDEEIYELREVMRRNPNMRVLFSAAKNATPKQLKQAIEILKLLKASDDGAE